ncbi:MAG: protein-tyrosine phosphatase-like protein [Piptocephalis tieghemiana]|nr:MAG: protein-tyrosine phosphatase-like protein [Piptocephalis tieghemiana]
MPHPTIALLPPPAQVHPALTAWSRKDRYTAQEVSPGIFLGPSLLSKNPDFLTNLGITHLLGIQSDGPEALPMPSPPTSGQFPSLSLALPSTILIGNLDSQPSFTSSLLPILIQAIEFARQVRLQGGTLLIHCTTGMDQSPLVTAAILIDSSQGQMDWLDAVEHVRIQRRCCTFPPFHQSVLKELEPFIHPSTTTSTTPSTVNSPTAILSSLTPNSRRRRRSLELDEGSC